MVFDLSVKKAREGVANFWVEYTVMTSGEEKADKRKEGRAFCHALEEEECKNYVRSQGEGELGPAAFATGKWPRIFGRG